MIEWSPQDHTFSYAADVFGWLLLFERGKPIQDFMAQVREVILGDYLVRRLRARTLKNYRSSPVRVSERWVLHGLTRLTPFNQLQTKQFADYIMMGTHTIALAILEWFAGVQVSLNKCFRRSVTKSVSAEGECRGQGRLGFARYQQDFVHASDD